MAQVLCYRLSTGTTRGLDGENHLNVAKNENPSGGILHHTKNMYISDSRGPIQ